MKLALVADDRNPGAAEAARALRGREPFVDEGAADVRVVVGGDGFMLHVLQQQLRAGDDRPLYGIDRGTVGFLMNSYEPDGSLLSERVEQAEITPLHPLEMEALDGEGQWHRELAINEVALSRGSAQTAKIRVIVDDEVCLDALAGDGVLVSTAAGSTAYNRSAGGPIIPLGAPLLALTPVAPFHPSRWRGALLSSDSEVRFQVLEREKRPVHATADTRELRYVSEVTVRELSDTTLRLLFDPGHGLESRILREQFAF